MQTDDGKLVVIAGASRSGKTAWTKKATSKERRVFAWDPDNQWAKLRGWKKVTNRAELLKLAKKPGPMKIAYVVGGDIKEEFNFWAGCVYNSTKYIEPTSAIAEELAAVSTPGKASGKWGELVRQGLKRGGNIFAISQRWQEADKTAVDNATYFVIFRQNGPKAKKYIESITGLNAEEIPSLQLEHVVFDPTTGNYFHDKLKF